MDGAADQSAFCCPARTVVCSLSLLQVARSVCTGCLESLLGQAARHSKARIDDAGASQVADLCVEALLLDEAQNKVVEVITDQSAPMMPPRALFASVF